MMSIICGYPRLTVDAQGVELATLINTTRYSWTDLQDYIVLRTPAGPVVALSFNPSYRRWGITRFLTRSTLGFEGVFPGMFSASLDEICNEMRAFQRRSP